MERIALRLKRFARLMASYGTLIKQKEEPIMNIPGFSAEASLYAASKHYSVTAVGVTNPGAVRPQLVLPPWTPCSWLFFCCTEFGDQSCCKRWRLQCVPE
jgi:hypothetical protein